MMDNQLIANLSMLYTDRPMLERFSAAAEYGFSGVEIQFPYEWCAQELKGAADNAGVRVHLINVPAGDLLQGGKGLSCYDEQQDEFRKACALALEYGKTLSVEKINVLAGNVYDDSHREACLSCYIDNLRYAAELFLSEGIMLSFEAVNNLDMPGYLYSRFDEMLDIYHKVAHPNAGMQYDIYHMARMGEKIAQQIRYHGDKIAHIQFADCPGRGAPGSGDLPLGEYFQLIAASDYTGVVSAEYKTKGNEQSDYGWLVISE